VGTVGLLSQEARVIAPRAKRAKEAKLVFIVHFWNLMCVI
jgi:hypothetical protein